MKKFFLLTFTVVSVITAGISCGSPAEPGHIIIVSIDALHPEALTEKSAPFIVSMINKGTGFIEGKSIDPPKTLYNHTAMFTGLTPDKSGQTSNSWSPGEPRIAHETIFHKVVKKGYETGYFYSKMNLGYLVNDDIQVHSLAGLDTIEKARWFIQFRGKTFTFLHRSGLEFAGMDHGWLSQPYLRVLEKIDHQLKTLLQPVIDKGRFVIIITSDHAGHGKEHGTSHPEDFRIPIGLYSDYKKVVLPKDYRTTDLKGIIESILR